MLYQQRLLIRKYPKKQNSKQRPYRSVHSGVGSKDAGFTTNQAKLKGI